MSYLDKAKGVAIKESVKSKESITYENNELTNKGSQTAQTPLNPLRTNPPDTLPRLPWQLERLISAACADVLPKGTVTLSSGLVTDLGRYVLVWGCSYIIGDRTEAARRLWEAYRAWQGVN